MQETMVGSLGLKDYLEKRMAIYSTIFAWRIPWTEEPGGLQSIGSQRVGQDWAIKTFTFQGWQWKLPDQGIRGLEFIVPPGKLWEGERGWRLTKSPMSDELFSEASIKTLKDGIHRDWDSLPDWWTCGDLGRTACSKMELELCDLFHVPRPTQHFHLAVPGFKI